MTNKEIAKTFQFLGSIMELHGENPYKIRSYQNAYLTLRKLPESLREMTDEQIGKIKGVGNAISAKIRELLDTGDLQTLQKYRDQTPEGVQEMLQIKGFGPKKIRVIWKDLGAETIGELLYAVNENRLVELKGFGAKTQEDLRKKLEYFQKSRNQFHYASLEAEAERLLDAFSQILKPARVAYTGALHRQNPILTHIELITDAQGDLESAVADLLGEGNWTDRQIWEGSSSEGLPLRIVRVPADDWVSAQFEHSATSEFLHSFQAKLPADQWGSVESEEDLFTKAGLAYIPPALRESEDWIERGVIPQLVQEEDIKGVVHAHSTYSYGLNSLREMAEASRSLGYEYLGITDHSKAAFYANGLQVERVYQQMEEIDQLNTEWTDFKIFKGIECDILNDGSLDYDEEVLQAFDFIIASVHTNLRMDEEKATSRIIKAVENPYTTILGHPTGRLLLSRPGYPLDHQRVIDACAARGVAIELNANPYRLDLDWHWIDYALGKGVLISVNPDAHSIGGIKDIHFGILAAQKGGLTAETCLNAKNTNDFTTWIEKKKNNH
ncbi:MAG: PHP domain-containing protein [Bacteroidota bacterium]